jgi:tRNA modification GTPase
MSQHVHPHVVQLTSPGRSAVAVLRIEGPGAIAAVQAHFHAYGGRPLTALAAGRLMVGRFGDDRAEEVVVRRCADNAMEIDCHGGQAAVARIQRRLGGNGCQPLGWQDWVRAREADPMAAAAWIALADTPTQRTAAILLDQYHGALRRCLNAIQQSMAEGLFDEAQSQAELLCSRVPLGRHLVRPWRIVLAGQVNAGKSSLMNALTGYARSIVHPTPGTTRDAVTATTAIDGWPVELCDTAGLRSVHQAAAIGSALGDAIHEAPKLADGPRTPVLASNDSLERAGIERTRARLVEADLVLLVFDSSRLWADVDQALFDHWPTALPIHNKCDLPSAGGDRPPGLPLSALRGEGFDPLLAAISHRLVPNPPPPGAAVPFAEAQGVVPFDFPT